MPRKITSNLRITFDQAVSFEIECETQEEMLQIAALKAAADGVPAA
jgi:predicted 3-demethylubiquinone-9 3-methyltransferase (glyoxalase superfamily)